MNDFTNAEPGTKIARVADRIDQNATKGIALSGRSGGVTLDNMNTVMEFAKMMAISDIAIPKHLRGNPGACLAISIQAYEWGITPFAAANKSYSVNDRLAYESQLIHAILVARAPIKGRLKVEYSGEGSDRRCLVWAKLRDEDERVEYLSPAFKDINPKNSPLWKNDPDQQLFYFSSRALCRRHFPDVLLGVFEREEMEAAEPMRNVTPKDDKSQAQALAANLAANAPTGEKGFDPAFVEAEGKTIDADPAPSEQRHDDKPRPTQAAVQPAASTMAEPASPSETSQKGAASDISAAPAAPTIEPSPTARGFDFDQELDQFKGEVVTFMSVAKLDDFGLKVSNDPDGWYRTAPDEIRDAAIAAFNEHREFLVKAEKANAKAATKTEPVPKAEPQIEASAEPEKPAVDLRLAALIAEGEKAAEEGLRKLKFFLGKLSAADFELWQTAPQEDARLQKLAREADEAF